MSARAASSVPEPARRVPLGLILLVLVTALLLGVVAALVAHSLHSHVAAQPARDGLRGQATWPAGVRPAPPMTRLHDQSGGSFSLASLHGRTVAIAFFDSHCHQACPLEGRALAAAESALPAARRPVLVVVSVNPRDTPASVRRAVQRWGLAGTTPWHWLMGTHAALARVWKAYHIFVAPTKGDITHTEAVYLLDRRGYERSAYLYPFVPRAVANDLRLLAAGEHHA